MGAREPAARTLVAELLDEHPWPGEYARARRLEWLWSVEVDVPPDVVWPLLADVGRINRALGLPRMAFAERDGVRWGQARYSGIRHEWQEVPWNWVSGRWFQLVRLYRKGGMRALHAVQRLTPIERGTRIDIYFGVVPAGRVFDMALAWSFGAMGRAFRKLLPRIASDLRRAPSPDCLQAPPPTLTIEARRKLEQTATSLVAAGMDGALVRQLVDWIASAPDDAIERIRVRERARTWNVDEDALLRTCLHATRAGLLDLSWDVVCPHCRGVRDATGVLASLPTEGDCEACGITFGTDTPDAVEITFHVQPGIRPVERGVYCSAEPAHKPHILLQRTVPAGETRGATAPTAPGSYRIRLRGEMRGAWIEIAPDAPGTLAWSTASLPTAARLAPGGTLTLLNDSVSPQTFVLEQAAWLELALRPGRLLSFQEFRDLFSDEYLGSGVTLAVGEQSILFTDLVGSTAMYAERGDPAAFVEVKKHFEQVFAIVAQHRGAIVKTIGDAVMAAFNDPVDAVRAARAVHDAFPPGRGPGSLRLRVSINSGTCIAVRLNSAIDYFGHTVNLAAKLQAVAEAWQIALGETTLAAPGVADYLAAQGAALEELAVDLKGIGAPVPVRRWTVARG